MLKLDLSFTITAIIAVISLLSPILTALINNRHLKKMRLLELEQERYAKNVLFKRQVFENYISMAGEFLTIGSAAVYKDFGSAHALAYLYADEELRHDMSNLHQNLVEHNGVQAKQDFAKIVPQVNAILNSLK